MLWHSRFELTEAEPKPFAMRFCDIAMLELFADVVSPDSNVFTGKLLARDRVWRRYAAGPRDFSISKSRIFPPSE